MLSSLERSFFWLDSDRRDGSHTLLLLLRLVLLHLLLRLLRLLRLVGHLRRGDVGLLHLLLMHLRSSVVVAERHVGSVDRAQLLSLRQTARSTERRQSKGHVATANDLRSGGGLLLHRLCVEHGRLILQSCELLLRLQCGELLSDVCRLLRLNLRLLLLCELLLRGRRDGVELTELTVHERLQLLLIQRRLVGEQSALSGECDLLLLRSQTSEVQLLPRLLLHLLLRLLLHLHLLRHLLLSDLLLRHLLSDLLRHHLLLLRNLLLLLHLRPRRSNGLLLLQLLDRLLRQHLLLHASASERHHLRRHGHLLYAVWHLSELRLLLQLLHLRLLLLHHLLLRHLLLHLLRNLLHVDRLLLLLHRHLLLLLHRNLLLTDLLLRLHLLLLLLLWELPVGRGRDQRLIRSHPRSRTLQTAAAEHRQSNSDEVSSARLQRSTFALVQGCMRAVFD